MMSFIFTIQLDTFFSCFNVCIVNEWSLAGFIRPFSLSSAEAPSVEGGEKKTRKMKNMGSAGDDGNSEKAGASAR